MTTKPSVKIVDQARRHLTNESGQTKAASRLQVFEQLQSEAVHVLERIRMAGIALLRDENRRGGGWTLRTSTTAGVYEAGKALEDQLLGMLSALRTAPDRAKPLDARYQALRADLIVAGERSAS